MDNRSIRITTHEIY